MRHISRIRLLSIVAAIPLICSGQQVATSSAAKPTAPPSKSPKDSGQRREPDPIWAELAAVGGLLSGLGGVSIIVLTWVIHRASSKAAEALRLEEWNRDFREIHADFWQSDTLGQVRGWIANENLYTRELEPVLELRKFGAVSSKDYEFLEKLDRFCALLARVLYLQGRTMTDEQSRLWRMMNYDYWFVACAKRPLVAEYMDNYWLKLHRHGELARNAGLKEPLATSFEKISQYSSDELLRWIDSSTPCAILDYSDGTEIGAIDLSVKNKELAAINPRDTKALVEFIDKKLFQSGKKFLVGGYGEKRSLYERSAAFSSGGEQRDVHLGLDLWGRPGDPVYCPLPGKVHSFKDNNNFGDYGPTIIVEHSIWDKKFYSLFGHLSRDSIRGLNEHKHFSRGDRIGTLGTPDENGQWPAHLHYQLIRDMAKYRGDYPGVVEESKAIDALKACPNPNALLRFSA
jgi:murein DD-endopeptidase MepM/ murein hydrolase activator NlpD